MECFLEIASLGIPFYDEAVMHQVQALKNIRTGIKEMNDELIMAVRDKSTLESKVNNLTKELQSLQRNIKAKDQSFPEPDDDALDSSSNFEAEDEPTEDVTLPCGIVIDDCKDQDIKTNGKIQITGAQKRKRKRSRSELVEQLERMQSAHGNQVLPVSSSLVHVPSFKTDVNSHDSFSTQTSKMTNSFKLARVTSTQTVGLNFPAPADYTRTEFTLNALKDEVSGLKTTLNSLLMNQTKILTQNTHIENQLNVLLSQYSGHHAPPMKDNSPYLNGTNVNSTYQTIHAVPTQPMHVSSGHPMHSQAPHAMHGQPVIAMYSPNEHLIHKSPEEMTHSSPLVTIYKPTDQNTPKSGDFTVSKISNSTSDATTSQSTDRSPPKSPDPPTMTYISSPPSKEPLSQELLLRIQGRSHSVKNFAVNLMRHFFTKEEMQGKNVRGSSKQYGKSGLDPARVQLIKHYVQATHPVEDEASQWQSCVDAMNEALRRKR